MYLRYQYTAGLRILVVCPHVVWSSSWARWGHRKYELLRILHAEGTDRLKHQESSREAHDTGA